MAFENLEAYRNEIVQLRAPGPNKKTLQEVCDYLYDKYKHRVTPSTLSRYLSNLSAPPGIALREPTEAERDKLDAIALLTEVLTEVRGRGDEQRQVIEKLAGQVAICTSAIEELERKVANPATGAGAPSPAIIRQIWLRALMVSTVAVAIAATAIVWLSR